LKPGADGEAAAVTAVAMGACHAIALRPMVQCVTPGIVDMRDMKPVRIGVNGMRTAGGGGQALF